MKIRWETPTVLERGGNNGRGSPHIEFANELRKRPGEWAVFKENAWVSTTGAINTGRYAAFRPKGDFEATSRGIQNGKATIYVRYVGTSKS